MLRFGSLQVSPLQRYIWHAVVFATLVSSCGLDPCANILKGEAVSPDGRYVASTYVTSCGATTTARTAVGLRPAQLAFEASTGQPAVLLLSGEWDVSVAWDGGNRLSVVAPLKARQHQLNSWHDVAITYREPSIETPTLPEPP
jgi:hypothetical protein